VDDPVFERKNTKTNTPAIIYIDIVHGDKIKFTVIPKGFGIENVSAFAINYYERIQNAKILGKEDPGQTVLNYKAPRL
jgi:tartrate dehydratase alpha subunit/fumarate hydratase class I-like protein